VSGDRGQKGRTAELEAIQAHRREGKNNNGGGKEKRGVCENSIGGGGVALPETNPWTDNYQEKRPRCPFFQGENSEGGGRGSRGRAAEKKEKGRPGKKISARATAMPLP